MTIRMVEIWISATIPLQPTFMLLLAEKVNVDSNLDHIANFKKHIAG